ncbi:DUF4192 domain-containing protein [Streptomyces sp. NPDC048361]|uniref:DUF4192 domain-containing protein n=1 Tax=Streptomyces sp. NPDC048361 TaxID=3154720 RepID=UPI00343B9E21
MRGPAELADALPYLLGFHPTDSAVLVALHGESGRFGGRVRVGLPASPQEWPDIADQLAECLVTGSEQRGPRPDGIVVFLCQDPLRDGSAHEVMERLRPLAQRLRIACGSLDVPVLEALCISDGRYWSYCCPDTRCCPPEGNVLALPGTSVMAAAATYAGIHVRGSLREMEERFAPWRAAAAEDQERALDAAAAEMFPRILTDGDRRGVADETLDLAARLMRRIAEAPVPPRGAGTRIADGRGAAGTLLLGGNAADELDDGLIAHDEAAAVILGLQDRTTRDWAAEWMEGAEAQLALRLWRALARRCVGPYRGHAAALLTLAGWVSWSTGDDPNARVAFGLALRADPEYRFAYLLHQACNQGLDPEELRICLREERAARRAGSGAAEEAKARTDEGASARVREGANAGTDEGASARVREGAKARTDEGASARVREGANAGTAEGASTQVAEGGARRKPTRPSGKGTGGTRPSANVGRPAPTGPHPAGPQHKTRARVRRRGGERTKEQEE